MPAQRHSHQPFSHCICILQKKPSVAPREERAALSSSKDALILVAKLALVLPGFFVVVVLLSTNRKSENKKKFTSHRFLHWVEDHAALKCFFFFNAQGKKEG
jgi:hypothetical protein